jgi:hypothetical protein
MGASGVQQIIQGTTFTQFHDHEDLVTRYPIIPIPNNIGMFEYLKCFNLFNILHFVIGLFYCHGLETVVGADEVPSPDTPEIARTQSCRLVDYEVSVSLISYRFGIH